MKKKPQNRFAVMSTVIFLLATRRAYREMIELEIEQDSSIWSRNKKRICTVIGLIALLPQVAILNIIF